MKMNQSMQKLLDKHQILHRIDEIELGPDLATILLSGIVEIKGCYFLQALLPDGFDIEDAIQLAFDRTEIECDINHIHIDDYIFNSDRNKRALIEQSMRYTLSLQALLPQTSRFKIILACTLEPTLDCNVRFHKQRLGEEWLVDDLESYEDMLYVLD